MNSCREVTASEDDPDYSECRPLAMEGAKDLKENYDNAFETYANLKNEREKEEQALRKKIQALEARIKLQHSQQTSLNLKLEALQNSYELQRRKDKIDKAKSRTKFYNEISQLQLDLSTLQAERLEKLSEIQKLEIDQTNSCWDKAEEEMEAIKKRKLTRRLRGKTVSRGTSGFFRRLGSSLNAVYNRWRKTEFKNCINRQQYRNQTKKLKLDVKTLERIHQTKREALDKRLKNIKGRAPRSKTRRTTWHRK